MKRAYVVLLTLALCLPATGCDFVGDVIEFGFWTLIVLVLLLAGLVWGGFRMIKRMGGSDDRTGPPPR